VATKAAATIAARASGTNLLGNSQLPATPFFALMKISRFLQKWRRAENSAGKRNGNLSGTINNKNISRIIIYINNLLKKLDKIPPRISINELTEESVVKMETELINLLKDFGYVRPIKFTSGGVEYFADRLLKKIFESR
jgi:hypothetical protein